MDGDPRALPEADVHGFRERYDPWTGRAWLEVRGPVRRRYRIGEGYGEIRSALRTLWPDRPFDADWADGRFPPAPLGLPAAPVLALGLAGLLSAVVAAGLWAGPVAALLLAPCGVWPLVRTLDGVEISERGLRVGPPWAMLVPWHAVESVGIERIGRVSRVWTIGRRGAATGTIPRVLEPAVRARLRRIGHIPAASAPPARELRYASWRAAAAGIPWGVALATMAAAPWAGVSWRTGPFGVIAAGGAVAAGLALLGAAVEARATGWGTGAVGWLTLLYALIVTLVSLGTW